MTASEKISPTWESYQSRHDYNNWPNSIGFDGDDTSGPAEDELLVTGSIPDYACGTLYRTGPSSTQIQSVDGSMLKAHHWFDGFAQVYKFQIHPPSQPGGSVRVTYRARATTGYGKSDTITLEVDSSFGQRRDPCESFFAKVSSSFRLYWSLRPDKAVSPNIGVVLVEGVPGSLPAMSQRLDSKKKQRLVTATTDSNGLQIIDGDTLETHALLSQMKLNHSLQGPVTASHYSRDPITGDLFNFNLIFQPTPVYRVFGIEASTGRTDVLAMIVDAPPAYIHSIFITRNFVVLCIWGARYAWRGLKFLYRQNVIESLVPLDPNQRCIWYVIDRSATRKGVVATYTSENFFSFHTVNAWEETTVSAEGIEQTDIVADLATYSDLSVLTKYYYDNLRSDSANASASENMLETNRARMARYRLSNVPEGSSWLRKLGALPTGQAELVWLAPTALSVETPSIHPNFVTHKHRYVYGITNRGLSTFFDGVGKFDCETQTLLVWDQHGHTPGEPIFVPDPNAQLGDEDAGVVLTVVLDGYRGISYLVVLDAKTMKEIGRAESKHAVAFGFHGLHVSDE